MSQKNTKKIAYSLGLLLLGLLITSSILGSLHSGITLGFAELRILIALGQNCLDGEIANGTRGNLNDTLDTLLGCIVVSMDTLNRRKSIIKNQLRVN